MQSQETNIYALFIDMVKYEQNFGAYWIYLALIKGYLQKNDRPERMYDVPFTDEDIAEIHRMDKEDLLGINRVKLYATQVDGNKYALYFARHPAEVQNLHYKRYEVWPKHLHSVYKQHKYTEVLLSHSEEWVYIFELKHQAKVLPVFLGVVEV
ncbi:hypothetical protein DCE79_14675 [Lysinibacillus sp. 2017]|uniref:hypothetical protein n=1 Tax=unclassified Lysinibacillus TaxID=2636778 RepID=UPI000D52749B|nr:MULTISPECIES: hypothetical protein [unclassified Lysinibacillus]AWE08536.1 hypothetical protein DCE79_14675 [Lysinibacillus sp. 2017]TGN35628.1 hypothetical protein E4L99_08495 [Lysinibacillus sp. S2017]